MEVKFKNFNFQLDWRAIIGLGAFISGYALLNTLSERQQLKAFELDLKNQRFSLN